MDIVTRQTRPAPAPAGASTRTPDLAWRDRLVELHVLAEHGDTDAADTAARWLATDPAAYRVWTEVERTCRHLRAL